MYPSIYGTLAGGHVTLRKLQTLEYNMFHGVAFLVKREAAEAAETSQAEDKKHNRAKI